MLFNRCTIQTFKALRTKVVKHLGLNAFQAEIHSN